MIAMPHHDDELIAQYIELEPEFPRPDQARLREYGVSVVALITHLQAVAGDINHVAEAYEIPPEHVEAAVAFYRRQPDLIDARIALNTAAFTGSLQ